jgi:hypothetical protein
MTKMPGFPPGGEGGFEPAPAGSVPAGMTEAGAAARRPQQVPGPFGRMIGMADLPPPDTRRWVVRRKAEVVAAIAGGLLTDAEACHRYRLSPEELDLWRDSIERAGVPGLRVTRIQLYRDYVPPAAARPTGRDSPASFGSGA